MPDYTSIASVLSKLLPLVSRLSTSIRNLMVLILVSVGALIAVAGLKFDWSAVWLLAVGIILLLPLIVLAWFWWALSDIQQLPETLTEIQTEVRLAKQPKPQSGSILRQLFDMRGLLLGAAEVTGQYFSIAPLINPIVLGLLLLSWVVGWITVVVSAVILLVVFI